MGGEGKDLNRKVKSDGDEDKKNEIEVKYRTLSMELLLKRRPNLGCKAREKARTKGSGLLGRGSFYCWDRWKP